MDFFSREDKWEIVISFLVFFVVIPWVITSYVRKLLAEID
jgi:hypothetical protein